MRTYELMFVTNPRVQDDDLESMIEAAHNLIVEGGGTITRTDNWGRRKLAYPIEKQTEGKYVLVYFHGEDASAGIREVEHRMGQNDKILRYLTIRTDQELKRIYSDLTPELAAGVTGDEESEGEEQAAATEEEN